MLLAWPLGVRAQQPWSNVASPTTQALRGAIYANNLFVAVGDAGTILTSPDGLAWAAATSGTSKALLSVTWSPTVKQFVTVGDAGTILTSPDGSTWTARNSGSTQRLNGVAWSPKRFTYPDIFLVVGDNGTALTSFDLVTWTSQNTGDTGWLRGIIGGGGFVITGHDGTILTTDDNAVTFQRRVSGTTLDLQAIGASNLGQGYCATGVNFVLARTSDGGSSWSIDKTNVDGSQNGITYRALLPFNGALVIAGDGGRIIDEFGRSWATIAPLTATWQGLAANSSRIVAVGGNGSIASAPIDPTVPYEMTIKQSYLIDHAILQATLVRPSFNGPSAYQWSLNGQPIPGATISSLTIPTRASGTYTVTGSNFAGTISTSATLTLLPAPTPSGSNLVDLTFRPVLSIAPRVVVPLTDGRMYIGAGTAIFSVNGTSENAIARLYADGSLDPSFHVPDGALPAGVVQTMMIQPDGRLVVMLGQTPSSSPNYSLVRLNADGSLDPTFHPDPALSRTGSLPILLADGRWVSVEINLPNAGGLIATLHRYSSAGIEDMTFAPITLLSAPPAGLPVVAFADTPRFVGSRDTQNRVYLGVRYGDVFMGLAGGHSGTSHLVRLLADGQPDASSRPSTWNHWAFFRSCPPV